MLIYETFERQHFPLFRKFADVMTGALESRICLKEATESILLVCIDTKAGYHLDRTHFVTTEDEDKGSLLEMY
jgi:hypothetical protein